MRKWMNLIVEEPSQFSDEDIMNILKKFYTWTEDTIEITNYNPNTNEVCIKGREEIFLRETKEELPFILDRAELPKISCDSGYETKFINLPKFFSGTISFNYNKIESLENIPTGVKKLFLAKNNLTTLDGLPNTLILLNCANNPLTTLASLEKCKNLVSLRLSYSRNLPLLRILSVVKDEVIFYNTEGNSGPDSEEVDKIINEHIEKYSNMKERIYKCQYEMIKLGYKDNAKW
jgi:hypothetical protein